MEAYRTEDGLVAKFIHADGSETAIKAVPSQSTFLDPQTGCVETRMTDRRKYSVFVSSSAGCYLSCPMCHLTIKDAAYQKLTGEQILANLKEAMLAEVAVRPELRERYLKLCWMGMGDALNMPRMVREVSNAFLAWVFAEGLAAGMDSVDLSTVMPMVQPTWVDEFSQLARDLRCWPRNPRNRQVEQAQLATHQTYAERPPFRLFYSLHSAVQPTRDRMAPHTTPLVVAIQRLLGFARANPGALYFHQLFVDGLNDSQEEVTALAGFMNEHFPDAELRVLRYNRCDRSPWHEWREVDDVVKRLAHEVRNLKVQTSAGSEVQAACGQFLVANTRQVVRLRKLEGRGASGN